MAKNFDPYHKWLGIAPEERPPTHYRLLGLNLFESDSDVIEAAADRQMTYLQEVSQGSKAALAQRLLTELAAARLCLLNQEKKLVYDARIRKQLESIEGGQRARIQTEPGQQKSNSKVQKDSSEPTLAARKKKQARDSNPSQLAKAQKAKTAQQTDSGSTAPSKPERSDKRPLFIAGAVLGLILIALTAFFLIGEGESPPPTDIDASGASQVAESNKLPPPVEIPPVGSGRKVIVQPEISKKDLPTESTQREKGSTGTKPTLEDPEEQKEKSSKNAEEDKSPDEKSSESDEEKTTLVKKRPVRFIPLEIAATDTKTKFRYQKQGDQYYTAEGSTSAYYRMRVTGDSGPLNGLCLEMVGPAHQTANLTNMKIKSVQWSSVFDSLDQGGAETVIDENENAGWQLQFSDEEPVWAVFAAKRPFDPKFLIELKHESNAQRLSKFRLLGITGGTTAKEMSQAMRDRKLAEKPFADFVAHGLPEGDSGEVGLGSIYLGGQKLNARLFGGSSNVAGVSFTLKKVPTVAGDLSQHWEFLLSSDNQQTAVAELVQQGEKLAELTLRWLPEAAGLPRAADLQNGLLQLQIGEHSRSVPLREVVELVPLTYSPLKTVRPQIQVPAGVAAEDLRLALKFPQATFGVDGSAVLQVRGEDVETDILIKDNMVLKLDSSWKAPVITLSIKTQIQDEVAGKDGKKKAKIVPLKKALSELPKLTARIKKGEELLKIVQGVEKYAGRSRLKPDEKREIMIIQKRWRDFGLNPRTILNEKQAETLKTMVNIEIEKINNRALKLKDLQQWSKQFGREGVGAIEFRVYTLIDGVPLDLMRSTGWQS